MDEQRYNEQLQREEECNNCGYNKFLKEEREKEIRSDGSNTLFGLHVKKYLLPLVLEDMRKTVDSINRTRTSRLRKSINKILQVSEVNGKFKEHDWIDLSKWGFLGFQVTLDTVLNPNFVEHTVQGRSGGDKKLLEKMSVPQLEKKIGDVINTQNQLEIIQRTFPEWFHKTDKISQKSNRDGNRSSTSYWLYRMKRSMKEFSKELKEKGDHDSVQLLEGKSLWNYEECIDIGSWILRSLITTTGLFVVIDERNKRRKNKSSLEIYLSEEGENSRSSLMEYTRRYTHEQLPMLIEPLPITNESRGGWLSESLQKPQYDPRGSIDLSPKHLLFINRQSRVPFQINPNTFRLMEMLMESELPLGKFHYRTLSEIPTVSQLLGYGDVEDKEEQTRLVRSHPDYKSVRREVETIRDTELKKVREGMLSRQVVEKGRKSLNDERFYFPLDFDFRGRIYPRVPFINYQSNDSGRYLIRFSNKTPIDSRTEFWFKVGISNSCGNDKLSWDKRLSWFDRHQDDLIQVGRMVDEDGDFSRGYDFLTKDFVDDPFCLFSLCNEYVKIFVDRTQDYSQCFITVDCSCSGTSIFNSWRLNLNGGRLTNLIDTPKPEDIYIELWNEIKKNVKPNSIRLSLIQRLEETKKIRKYIKENYIPTQYSSKLPQQHYRLKVFNTELLEPSDLNFTDEELQEVIRVWGDSFDEVSGINKVVNWFQSRTKDVLMNGGNEIRYTSSNGSVMTLRYPKSERKKIRTFHYGSTELLRETWKQEKTNEVNRRELRNSIVPNITHLTDSTSLSESLWDYEGDFCTIHDCLGVPPSKNVDKGIERLKDGFIKSTKHNVWETFCLDNDLTIDPSKPPPIVGDLDLELIRQSNYLYS